MVVAARRPGLPLHDGDPQRADDVEALAGQGEGLVAAVIDLARAESDKHVLGAVEVPHDEGHVAEAADHEAMQRVNDATHR